MLVKEPSAIYIVERAEVQSQGEVKEDHLCEALLYCCNIMVADALVSCYTLVK